MIDDYLKAGNERANLPPEKFPSTEEAPEPTSRDYERGGFKRFFIRKRGTAQISEITEDEYKSFSESRYFIRFSLKWKISGPRHDVFNSEGYPIETGVEDTNRRIVKQTDQRGIENFLNDPLQYWDERRRD